MKLIPTGANDEIYVYVPFIGSKLNKGAPQEFSFFDWLLLGKGSFSTRL